VRISICVAVNVLGVALGAMKGIALMMTHELKEYMMRFDD